MLLKMYNYPKKKLETIKNLVCIDNTDIRIEHFWLINQIDMDVSPIIVTNY